MDELTEPQKKAYQLENVYLPYRKKVAIDIEKGLGVFLVPSAEYIVLDQAVKLGLKAMIHSEEGNFVLGEDMNEVPDVPALDPSEI